MKRHRGFPSDESRRPGYLAAKFKKWKREIQVKERATKEKVRSIKVAKG